MPTTGSYLVWKTLFDGELGRDQNCLDVGCGCGILSVQLALNGAARVHAIDIDESAVANTLSNGFRNGVADRLTGETVDLYQWEPSERFDLIAASLYQMPVDPYEEPSGHRPLDYWGRNLLDHFIRLLPRLLTEDGIAYVMQLSILGQDRTAQLLADGGLEAKVVDFSFFPFGPVFLQNKSQIERVEQLSDAYHLRFRRRGRDGCVLARSDPILELIRLRGVFDMTQTEVREVPALDFKVADLSLAEWGRKEIGLAEHEMPGLDVGAP